MSMGEFQRKRRGMMSMEEFERRRRGMMTTREWCNPVSHTLHHMKEGLSGDWAREV